MTLTGILKNIILVIASVLIWTTHITALQVFGYAIALGGLVYYSVGWNVVIEKASEFSTWLGSVTGTSGAYTLLDESRLSPTARKSVIIALCALVTTMLLLGYYIGRLS